MARYPKGSKVIKLSQGYEAIVDAEDYPLLSQVSWHLHRSRNGVYARATLPGTGGKRKVLMHRLLCGVWAVRGKDLQVDHLNHRTLDNRKTNLQVVSNIENQRRRRDRLARSARARVY